jgi:hypothetical protein
MYDIVNPKSQLFSRRKERGVLSSVLRFSSDSSLTSSAPPTLRRLLRHRVLDCVREGGHLIDRREHISINSPQVLRQPQLHIVRLWVPAHSCDGYFVVDSFTNSSFCMRYELRDVRGLCTLLQLVLVPRQLPVKQVPCDHSDLRSC